MLRKHRATSPGVAVQVHLGNKAGKSPIAEVWEFLQCGGPLTRSISASGRTQTECPDSEKVLDFPRTYPP